MSRQSAHPVANTPLLPDSPVTHYQATCSRSQSKGKRVQLLDDGDKSGSPSEVDTPNFPSSTSASVENGHRRHRMAESDEAPQAAPDSDSNGTRKHRSSSSRLLQRGLRLYQDYYAVKYLENKASVARDHLANERTYLAWLRTSLSLTSIGVAVTQLFRLSSADYTSVNTVFSNSSTSSSQPSDTTTSTPSLPPGSNVDEIVAQLVDQVEQQAMLIEKLAAHLKFERDTYIKLGKPIGVTFIAIGLIFLSMGTQRYFTVQYVLQRGQYPLSRRSIAFASTAVASLVVAAFAVIVSFGPQW